MEVLKKKSTRKSVRRPITGSPKLSSHEASLHHSGNTPEISDILNTVKKMEDALENSKQKKSRLLGTLDALMNTLKKEFNVSNIGEAKKLSQRMEKDIQNIQKSISESMVKIKNHFAAIGDI